MNNNEASECVIDNFIEVVLNIDNQTYSRKMFVKDGELIELKAFGETALDPSKQKDVDIDDFFFLVGQEAEKIL